MPIRKQEFYEGAALHLLARTGKVTSIRYEAPFFHLNDRLSVLLKYSTRVRSPWGFTFTPDEQILLHNKAAELEIVLGLICGADGIVAFAYEDYVRVAARRSSAVHIACYRDHHEHYKVSGPDGILEDKVAPSDWRRILEL